MNAHTGSSMERVERRRLCLPLYPVAVGIGILSVVILLWSELVWLAWTIRSCRSTSPLSRNTVTFAAISDIHILGRERSALDIAWTDYQTRKALWALSRFGPKLRGMVVLGDILDQLGRYPEVREEWSWFLRRYEWVMRDFAKHKDNSDDARENFVIDSVIGNHDAQFVYLGSTPWLMDWFSSDLGPLNGMKRLEDLDVELIWVNAMSLFDNTTVRTKSHEETIQFLQSLPAKPKGSRTKRILLSHVPSFRENDLDCDKDRLRERAHVTYFAPEEPLRNAFDVFNEQVSQDLLSKVSPDLMLSGHLHSQCVKSSSFLDGQELVQFMDVSVPSFSYRMRPDPGYAVVYFDKESRQFETKICKLPSEPFMIAMDIAGGIGLATAIVLIGVARWSDASKSKSKAL